MTVAGDVAVVVVHDAGGVGDVALLVADFAVAVVVVDDVVCNVCIKLQTQTSILINL